MGAGRVGKHLAKLLKNKRHEVAILEKDKNASEQLSRETDVLVVNGDGTEVKTLEEVNAKNAQVLIAVTDRDEVNLLSSLVAKDLGVKTVVARVSNPEHREVFKKLGIDFVVSPEVTAAEYIEKLIMRPNAADFAILGRSDVEILEFTVTKESKLAGKSVEQVRPRNFLFIAVYKKEEMIIPNGSTTLEAGDRVVVLTKSEAVKHVEALFG